MRGTILQPWNWYTPIYDARNMKLWERLTQDVQAIKRDGYTAVWLPPSSVALNGINDVGYGIKDWNDFNNTKYGDKEQLQQACIALRDAGIHVYHDQVFNHLMGGTAEHDAWCLSVKKNNKNEKFNDDCIWFKGQTQTGFPWLGLDHSHFDAYMPDNDQCWVLTNKQYQCEVNDEYLMGCDLNYDNIDLIQKLYESGRAYKNQFHVDGYRFDAVKHIRPKGTLDFLREMRRTNNGKGLFAVAEFLHDDCDLLLNYISKTNGELSLFDVPLQRKMVMASSQGNRFDMGSIFNYTLTSKCPTLAVTYVHSHDDQPAMSQNHSSRGSYVGDWFISQAYALILLRDVGYPVVSDVDTIRHSDMIKRYMLLRTNCTYGARTDRFDHSNTVGWSFTGDSGFDNSMAVVITNGDYGKKWLYTGKPHITYRDFTGALSCMVTTNRDGWGEFECQAGNTSAWVEDSKFYSLNAGINA